MPESVAQLIEALKPDPWRDEVGFSSELEEAHKLLFGRSPSKDALIKAVNGWVQRYQPCLFGRVAAKSGFLSYCILTEADLTASDESIRAKIKDARLQWTREAFEGKKNRSHTGHSLPRSNLA